jgi:hypothetical protein
VVCRSPFANQWLKTSKFGMRLRRMPGRAAALAVSHMQSPSISPPIHWRRPDRIVGTMRGSFGVDIVTVRCPPRDSRTTRHEIDTRRMLAMLHRSAGTPHADQVAVRAREIYAGICRQPSRRRNRICPLTTRPMSRTVPAAMRRPLSFAPPRE